MKISFNFLRAMLLASLFAVPVSSAFAAKPSNQSLKASGGKPTSFGQQSFGVTKKLTPTPTPPRGQFVPMVKPKLTDFSKPKSGNLGIVPSGMQGKGIGTIKPINTRPKIETKPKFDSDLLGKIGRTDTKLPIKISDMVGGIKTLPGKNPILGIKPIVGGGIKTMPFKPGKFDPSFGQYCPPQNWCVKYPSHCWWWYNYCPVFSYCPTVYHYPCNWNYVTCNYVYGGTIIQNVKFHLGVNGMLLPGKGLGIETVEAGSPADLAGLKPGMVIVSANGLGLTSEGALSSAMSQSNGLLQLQVTSDGSDQPVAVNVQLQRMIVRSF